MQLALHGLIDTRKWYALAAQVITDKAAKLDRLMLDEFKFRLKRQELTTSQPDLDLAFGIWGKEAHADANHLMAEFVN